MINGVEILNQYIEETSYISNSFTIALIWLILTLLITLISNLIIYKITHYIDVFDITLGIIIGFFIGAVISLNFVIKEETIQTPIYEVIISEEASFEDIFNTYDIIEQRGKIYVIKEKKE